MTEENTDDFNEEKEAAEAMEAAKLEADKKEEDNKGKEKEEEEEFDEKEEPPTRKSVQDYIIDRKDKKIAKLEKKEEDDSDNFTPEDKDAIGKEVEKKTAPLEIALKAQSDKNDIDALKISHPEMSKVMEKRVVKYRDHNAYQNIPVENIYLMLAGQKSNLQAKKAEAKKEDRKNETGGHTSRKGDKKLPDFRKMSGKEFDEYDRNSSGQF